MKDVSKLLILVILTFSFLSCDRNNPDFRIIQNGLVLETYRNEKGELVIDEKNSACFSRKYQFSIDRVGPVGEDEDMALEDCADLIGYSPENYKKVAEFNERVRSKIKDELGDKINKIYKDIEREGEL